MPVGKTNVGNLVVTLGGNSTGFTRMMAGVSASMKNVSASVKQAGRSIQGFGL